MEQTTQKCTKCGETKPLDDFYQSNRYLDGHTAQCKACKRLYYLKNIDTISANNARWREENKDWLREYRKKYQAQSYARDKIKQYYKAHPERRRATNTLNRAIAKGTIKPKKRCEVCKKKERIDAHHDDYSKPLAVKWLCRKCHRHADLLRAQAEAGDKIITRNGHRILQQNRRSNKNHVYT